MKPLVTTAIVWTALGALAGGVRAQVSPAPPAPQTTPAPGPIALTLKDAIARGLATNLTVLVGSTKVDNAQGTRTRALSDLLPHLSANVRESQQIISTTAFGFSGFQGIPSLIGPFNVFDARLNLSAPIIDISAHDELRARDAELVAERQTFQNEREIVMLAVAQLYLDALSSASRVDAVRAQVATAEALARLTDDQRANGLVAGVDAVRQQVEVQSARQRLIGAENAAAKTRLLLARAIGLPVDQTFTLADQMQDVAVPVPDLSAATETAMSARADVKSAQARVDAARAARASASSTAWPSLHFDGDIGVIGNTISSTGRTYTVGALVHVPLYTGGDIKGKEQQADATLRQREAELADLKTGVSFEIAAALLDLQTAAAAVDVARNASTLAAEELRQTQDRFQAGVSNTIELAHAQDNVASASDTLIASIYQHNIAKALLARAMGVVETRLTDILGGK